MVPELDDLGAIKACIGKYIEGSARGARKLLEEIFLPSARMAGGRGGGKPQFWPRVKKLSGGAPAEISWAKRSTTRSRDRGSFSSRSARPVSRFPTR